MQFLFSGAITPLEFTKNVESNIDAKTVVEFKNRRDTLEMFEVDACRNDSDC